METNAWRMSIERKPAPLQDVSDYVVGEIVQRFQKADRPIVLIDACAGRFGMAGEVGKLVEICKIPYFDSEQIRAYRLESDPS
jgi:pyruvate decarboxylase